MSESASSDGTVVPSPAINDHIEIVELLRACAKGGGPSLVASLDRAADEIEALRGLIRVALEIGVLDELGFHDGRGMSTSLLPGEWSGVIARAENGRGGQS